MATITVKTEDGLTHEFIFKDGMALPTYMLPMIPHGNFVTHLAQIRHMEIRDDDVYLATYPKSGTHWAWEIIQMLRKGNAEYETAAKEVAFLDFKSTEHLAGLPSPRTLNSHYPPNATPRQVIEKGVKIVHVQRNPKDMAVSRFNHMKALWAKRGQEPLTFSQFLSLVTGQYGVYFFWPWCKYVKDWERFQKQHPNQILTISFEDLKEDPIREIRKVNSFLGYNRSEELMADIAEACSFHNLKKADKEIKREHKPEKMKNSDFMYRKGEVGDWKNWFTVAQNEMMDAWLEENLVDTDLKFRYEL